MHWEMWSKDPEKVSKFYAQAFGWKVNHLAEMNYRLVETGGEGGINGGIMQPQAGPWPANLCLYIDVDDLATFRNKVKKAGGKIVVEQQDVPQVGSFCLFEDPDGRLLGMWKQGK